MKYLKKFAVILCAAVLLLCMTSCAGVDPIRHREVASNA